MTEQTQGGIGRTFSEQEKHAGGQIGTKSSEGPFLTGGREDRAGLSQLPSLGRIVIYTATADDASAVNRRIEHSKNHLSMHKAAANGTIVHVGNELFEGEHLPMMVVRADGDLVNGQVFLDGNSTLWVHQIPEGEGPGTWAWPERK